MIRYHLPRVAVGVLSAATAVCLALATFGAALANTPEWAELVKAAQQEGKVEVILSGQMPQRLRATLPSGFKRRKLSSSSYDDT